MRLQIMTCQGVLILKQDQLSENADEEPLELGYSLFDTHMRLSRAFHAMKTDTRTCARALGLGPGQPRILSYLAAHGVSTQREIARYLVIDPSAVSRMLDALERGGFVQSVPGRDRRCRSLDLTEHGRTTVQRWDAECRRVDELMLTGFSPEERVQFNDLLDRARANMTRELGDAGDDADAFLAGAVPPLPKTTPKGSAARTNIAASCQDAADDQTVDSLHPSPENTAEEEATAHA